VTLDISSPCPSICSRNSQPIVRPDFAHRSEHVIALQFRHREPVREAFRAAIPEFAATHFRGHGGAGCTTVAEASTCGGGGLIHPRVRHEVHDHNRDHRDNHPDGESTDFCHRRSPFALRSSNPTPSETG
jgi:hypothetical protein